MTDAERPEMISDRLGYPKSVGDDDWARIEAIRQATAERIARAYLDEAELVGREMHPQEEPEPWTLDTLSEEERTGLIATIRRLLDKGVIVAGPKGWS